MKMWTLMLFVHGTSTCRTVDESALDHVPGHISQDECLRAGNITKKLVEGTHYDLTFTCVETLAP